MTPRERLERLDALAAHLPFHVEDHEAANRTFARWAAARGRGADDESAWRDVELWVYCFTHRYALVRFVREPELGSSADLDTLISDVFLRVREKLEQVQDPARFTHWASVVCRNTFISYCRHRAAAPAVAEAGPDLQALPAEEPWEPVDLDRRVLRQTVEAALERLPDSCRVPARLRLLENHSYEYIEARLGLARATARSFVSKAVARLRRDPALRGLMDELGLTLPPEERRPGARGP